MAVPLADGDVVCGDVVAVVLGVVVAVVDGVVVDASDGDGLVVMVVVDGGGAASLVCGCEPPESPPDTSTVASTAATANIRIVATTSATCVGPNRDFRVGAAGAGSGG
jgi:hypothetical protein